MLVNIRQGRDETQRVFMQRYNEVVRRVKGVNHTFIISNLSNCLKPGYVAEHLYAEQPKTMEELQEKMTKFIRMEDLRNSKKKQHPEALVKGDKRESGPPHGDNQNHRPPQREIPLHLGPRYGRYVNLNARWQGYLKKP